MQYLEGFFEMSSSSFKSLTWPRYKKVSKTKKKFEELKEFYENEIKKKQSSKEVNMMLTKKCKALKYSNKVQKEQQLPLKECVKYENDIADKGKVMEGFELSLTVKQKAAIYQSSISTNHKKFSNNNANNHNVTEMNGGRRGFVKKICEKLENDDGKRPLENTNAKPKYKSFIEIELETARKTSMMATTNLYNTDIIKVNTTTLPDNTQNQNAGYYYNNNDGDDNNDDFYQSYSNNHSPCTNIADNYNDSLPFSINSDTSSIDQGFETESMNRTNTSTPNEEDSIKSCTFQSKRKSFTLKNQKNMKCQHFYSMENVNENDKNVRLVEKKTNSQFHITVGIYTMSLKIYQYPSTDLIYQLDVFKKKYSQCKNCNFNFGIDNQAFFTNRLSLKKIQQKLFVFKSYSQYWFSVDDHIACFNGPKLSSEKIRNIFYHFYQSIRDEYEDGVLSCGVDDYEFFSKFIEEYFECH